MSASYPARSEEGSVWLTCGARGSDAADADRKYTVSQAISSLCLSFIVPNRAKTRCDEPRSQQWCQKRDQLPQRRSRIRRPEAEPRVFETWVKVSIIWLSSRPRIGRDPCWNGLRFTVPRSIAADCSFPSGIRTRGLFGIFFLLVCHRPIWTRHTGKTRRKFFSSFSSSG